MKQGEKTKKKILETSDRLFYTKGYNATSFSDIVETLELSKGNITYHFKNKKQILEGIIAKRIREITASFQEWEASTEEPYERLLLFCDMIVKEHKNLEKFGCPMGTLTAEFSKNEPELYAITLPMFQAYRTWLKEQFMLLGLENEKADEEAMSLLAKVQGIAMIMHSFKDKAFLFREMDKVKEELKTYKDEKNGTE